MAARPSTCPRARAVARGLAWAAVLLLWSLAAPLSAHADSWTAGSSYPIGGHTLHGGSDENSTDGAVLLNVGAGTYRVLEQAAGAWVQRGGDFSAGTGVDVIGGSTPVIAAWDPVGNRWRIHRWSGSSWTDLALPALTGESYDTYAKTMDLAGTASSPVIARRGVSGGTYSVVVQSYGAGTWNQLGTARGSGASAINDLDLFASNAGTAVTWSRSGDVFADWYNLGASSWETMGSPDGADYASGPTVVIHNGIRFVAWNEHGSSYLRPRVNRWTGTAWAVALGVADAYPVQHTLTTMRLVAGRPTLLAVAAQQQFNGITRGLVMEWWGSRFIRVGDDLAQGSTIDGVGTWLLEVGRRPAVAYRTPPDYDLRLSLPLRGGSTSLVDAVSPPGGYVGGPWQVEYGGFGCGGIDESAADHVVELQNDVDGAIYAPGACDGVDPVVSSYWKSPADPDGVQPVIVAMPGVRRDVTTAVDVRVRVSLMNLDPGDSMTATVELRSSDGIVLSSVEYAPVGGTPTIVETPPISEHWSSLVNSTVHVYPIDAGGPAGTQMAMAAINLEYDAQTDWTARVRPDSVLGGGDAGRAHNVGAGCVTAAAIASVVAEDVEAPVVSGCAGPGTGDEYLVGQGFGLGLGALDLLGGRVVSATVGTSKYADASVDETPQVALSPAGAASCFMDAGPLAWCHSPSVSWDQATLDAASVSYAYPDAFGAYLYVYASNVDVLVDPGGGLPLAPPAAVRDGAGADVDGQASTTALSANWDTVTHADFASYEYCFSTSSTGSTCASASPVAWTATSATSVTRPSLSLTAGVAYFTCVRSVHGDATRTAATCSDGSTVDVAAPGVPTLVSPAGGAGVTAAPTLAATYADGHTDGRVEFQVCATSTCAAATASGASSVVANGANGTWIAGAGAGTWYWRARNVDSAGNASAWTTTRSYVFTSTPTATLMAPAANAWVTSAQPGLQVRHADSGNLAGTVQVETCSTNAASPWAVNCGASYQVFASSPGAVAHNQVVTLSPNAPLAQGTSYWRARSTNTAGTASAFTAAQAIRVDSLHPTPIPTVTFERKGKGRVDATWNTATDPVGGIGGVEWDVETWNAGTSAWEPLCTNTTALSCTKTGLGGTELLIARVRVCDGLGNCSDWTGSAAAANSGYLFRNLASSNLNNTQSRAAQLPPGGTLDSTTTGVTLPGGGGANRVGTFPLRYNTVSNAAITLDTTAPIDPQSTTAGWGWVIDGVENLTLPSGAMGVTVVTEPVSGTGTGTGTIRCRVWRATTNGSNALMSWTYLGEDTGDVADVMTGTGSGAVTSTCEWPSMFATQTSFGNNEVLYVEAMLQASVAGSSGDSYRLHFNAATGSSIDIPQPGSPPTAPDLVSPVDAAWVPQQPTLTATYQHPTPRQGSLQFQVATDAAFTSVVGTYASTLVSDDANGSVTATGLAAGTTYYWRARGTDSGSLVGPWSSPTRSFVTNSPPLAPSLTSPTNAAVLTPGAVTLQAGAFSDADTIRGDSHGGSQFQLVVDGGSWATPLVDHTSSTAPTSHVVPSPTTGSYRWRVRYRDSLGVWSAWSVERTFTMNAGTLSIGLDAASIALGLVARQADHFGSTGVTVASTGLTGYTLSAADPSDTTAMSCVCGGTVPDWTGTGAAPTLWPSGTHGFVGLTVRSASGGRLAKWGDGTDTLETDVAANRYAGLRSSSTTLHAYGGPTSADRLTATWRVNIPTGTPDGTYTQVTTLTAVANP